MSYGLKNRPTLIVAGSFLRSPFEMGNAYEPKQA